MHEQPAQPPSESQPQAPPPSQPEGARVDPPAQELPQVDLGSTPNELEDAKRTIPSAAASELPPIPPVPPVQPAREPEPVRASPPPPPPRVERKVEEVVASPLSASDARGPVVDAPPPRPAPPPPPPSAAETPPPPSAQTPPPSTPPASAPPPISGAMPGAGAPPAGPAPTSAAPANPRKRRIWSILSHLMLLLVIPTFFLGITITFLIWQLKGKYDRQVEDQGREALNFQINVAALTALLGISCIGGPLVPIVWLVAAIMAIIAARHASDGESYRYPWVLRIVTH